MLLLAAGCAGIAPEMRKRVNDPSLAELQRSRPETGEVLTWDDIRRRASGLKPGEDFELQLYENFIQLAAAKEMIRLCQNELKCRYDREIALRMIGLTCRKEKLSADLARQLGFYPGAELELDTAVLPRQPLQYDLPPAGLMEQLAVRHNSGKGGAFSTSETVARLRKIHAGLICAQEKFMLLYSETDTPESKLDRIQAAAEMVIFEKRLCRLLGITAIKRYQKNETGTARQTDNFKKAK